MRNCFGLLLCACLLCACSSRSPEEKAMLKEAYELQLEVIKGIKDFKSIIATQGGQVKDSLGSVLHEMEEALFEIPGYHIELPGHEGHDHGHNRLSLTAEEILEVQRELLQQVNDLKSSFDTND